MHELHQPRRNEEKCHSFKTLLPLLFLLCGKPQHGGGQRQSGDWISASSQPSSYTYPLHHSSIKTLRYSQVCNISCPKSPTQQIRCPVQFLSLHCSSRAQQTRSVSATTPAHAPVQAAPVHICFFFFFAFPFSLPNCN